LREKNFKRLDELKQKRETLFFVNIAGALFQIFLHRLGLKVLFEEELELP